MRPYNAVVFINTPTLTSGARRITTFIVFLVHYPWTISPRLVTIYHAPVAGSWSIVMISDCALSGNGGNATSGTERTPINRFVDRGCVKSSCVFGVVIVAGSKPSAERPKKYSA